MPKITTLGKYGLEVTVIDVTKFELTIDRSQNKALVAKLVEHRSGNAYEFKSRPKPENLFFFVFFSLNGSFCTTDVNIV